VPNWPAAEKRLRRQLAASVRRIRQEKKLTLEDVAHRAQMHWRHWQKVEAGEVNATLRTLARLSTALGVEPANLLEGP
jgi:transcriptional regulator with XRE-family HTH domain